MSNVKKPDPVAWRYWRESRKRFVYLFKEPKVLQRRHQCLITTGQAEAYKDACVREALEQAAKVCETYYKEIEDQSRSTYQEGALDAIDLLEQRIRALIPKQ